MTTKQHYCANCTKRWTMEELKPVEDLHQRVEPGGVMPSGECPDCHALCYPIHDARRARATGR